jgi:hypothetical protein
MQHGNLYRISEVLLRSLVGIARDVAGIDMLAKTLRIGKSSAGAGLHVYKVGATALPVIPHMRCPIGREVHSPAQHQLKRCL